MKSVKLLFFGFLGFILLCVLVLRPVNIPENENELLVAKGEVMAITEGPGNDIVFKLRDDNRRFYINRGLEQGLSIQDLQAKLTGRNITLKYPKHWSLMDPSGTTKHLSMVKYSGGTVFSELD